MHLTCVATTSTATIVVAITLINAQPNHLLPLSTDLPAQAQSVASMLQGTFALTQELARPVQTPVPTSAGQILTLHWQAQPPIGLPGAALLNQQQAAE